ncbi:4-diphosphocytidyl-2-C-methyl-D-erythritol kinase [Loktanella fryxellensis]|uniref:4-diphosphocytidyl-2-C-methyl-D-erythritol kinase n=1 Tax=Loktanella fryxellensis TaxID=245187 RepID=A0A1H8FQ22_9RHOB|nr:4-(cytidine 5'-diphospho)-2-C-methyl-D-erythritol kinase [Loktanella fryxellensis]SEN33792.1 4-diphosphocytidyl-2-C-methyl-D-erythritol kinase [Loktanella fryxellensis]
MSRLTTTAPAKINLTLHVTGRRDDGYHLLDSLVVFVDQGDRITVTPSPELRLTVTGPFAAGVPVDDGNLVMRAARALAKARDVDRGAAIVLDKHLPHAAGIGGGSADAAATLRVLAAFWNVAPLPGDHPAVLALGADVPACLAAPAPLRMGGVGELLQPAPALPDCALVLVNPRHDTPTPAVFKALECRDNPGMKALPDGMDVDGLAAWLNQQRNDLLAPARVIAPQIDAVLDRLRSLPAVKAVGLSGSGATCWGLVADMASARQAARAVQIGSSGWWVAPAGVLRAGAVL